MYSHKIHNMYNKLYLNPKHHLTKSYCGKRRWALKRSENMNQYPDIRKTC